LVHRWAILARSKNTERDSVLSIAGFLLALHLRYIAQAAPDPAITNELKWLNRYYIVDSNGNNYYDSNTYDNKYEYQEQGLGNVKTTLSLTTSRLVAPMT